MSVFRVSGNRIRQSIAENEASFDPYSGEFGPEYLAFHAVQDFQLLSRAWGVRGRGGPWRATQQDAKSLNDNFHPYMTGWISKDTKNLSDSFVGTLSKADPHQLVRQTFIYFVIWD